MRVTVIGATGGVEGAADSEVVIVAADADARAAAAALAGVVRAGTLVVFEAALPVGETRRLAAALGRAAVDVACAPAREGGAPRAVGGDSPAASARAAAFYGERAAAIDVGTLEAAELAALADAAEREVARALAAELERYARSIGVAAPRPVEEARAGDEAAAARLIDDAQRAGAPLTIAERARWTLRQNAASKNAPASAPSGAPPSESPADKPLPIARPLLAADEAEAAADVIRSGWVLQGPEVAAFERELGEFFGAPHACVVSSGTAALHLALLAAGVGPGDEVVTVSHSYIATANSVQYCGARPVFVDVCLDTFNIDPARIEAALTPRTKAILAVHQMGMPCDLEAIVAIARARSLTVVEDAACAAGSELRWSGRWERVGRPRGDLACFSWHPRKVVTTGDGGVVTTADAERDRRVRMLRQHGTLDGRTFPVVGWNYRMTDIQAAVGRAQLRRLPSLVAERRALAERYRAALSSIAGLVLPREPEFARSNWQSFCVRLPPPADPARVMRELDAAGIATRGGIMNAHEQPPYRAGAPSLPSSERALRESLTLPLFPGMTDADVQRVARALAAACGSRD